MSTNGDHWARQTYESLPILSLLLSSHCHRSAQVPPARRWRSVIASRLKRLTDCRPFIKHLRTSRWQRAVGWRLTFFYCSCLSLPLFQPAPLIVTNSDICACGSQKRRSHSNALLRNFFRVPRAEKPAKDVSTKISRDCLDTMNTSAVGGLIPLDEASIIIRFVSEFWFPIWNHWKMRLWYFLHGWGGFAGPF